MAVNAIGNQNPPQNLQDLPPDVIVVGDEEDGRIANRICNCIQITALLGPVLGPGLAH